MESYRTQQDQKNAYLNKTHAEINSLLKAGVDMQGNAFAPVLFVKSEFGQKSAQEKPCLTNRNAQANTEEAAKETAEQPLLNAEEKSILSHGLSALGYAPQDWMCISALSSIDETPLEDDLLRQAICALDPASVVSLDSTSAHILRSCYAEEFSLIEQRDVALFEPGLIAHILGMRFLHIGQFDKLLLDSHGKQFIWACLKRIPPLQEPY